MFKNILLPTDLAEEENAASQHALDLAQKHHAGLTLLHVIEVLRDDSLDELQDFYDELKHSAQEKLNNIVQKFTEKNVPCHAEVCVGHREAEILRFAAANKSDLIILRSHRVDPAAAQEGWATISYKVAILAQCPVLLVK